MVEPYTKVLFQSRPLVTDKNEEVRFYNHCDLQEILSEICNKWFEYFLLYHQNSQNTFNTNKMPWDLNERALVSTLASCIARMNPESLVVEEMPVLKPRKPSSGKNSDHGRCDLWVANLKFQEHKPLCFFLEAKKFRKPKSDEEIIARISGDKGISRLFRDYVKNHSGDRLLQKSPYGDILTHHYAISMLVVPFRPSDRNIDVKEELESVFSGKQCIHLGNGRKINRKLFRYPTVGMVVTPVDNAKTGMVATFTVVAEGNKNKA